ncbi:hypothetical protein C3L33_03510, partial [Rhododendron williamsianum]
MARCESCGLTEECTLAYISRIRERKFRSLSGETEDPISAIGRILRRSLHSPRSTPSSPMRESRRMPLIRCESCFSSISR